MLHRTLVSATSVVALVLLAVPARAANPTMRSFDIVVADSGNNQLVRLADFNQDGNYVASEALKIYDATSALGIGLANPSGMAYDTAGRLYLSDTTLDTILRFNDLTGDGDVLDAGEASVFLDNTNLSGVVFTSALQIAFDASGRLFGVNSGNGAAPLDFVFVATDLDGNGDANGAGEVTIVYDSTTGAFNIAVPFGLAIDPTNGDVLVADVNPDFIYRLHDADSNGDFYGPGEVTQVYSSPVGSPAILNVNTICFAPSGDLFANDATADIIIRLRDTNMDGDYNDPGEAVVWGMNPFGGSFNQFNIAVDEHGRVFAVENSNADQVLLYEDLNQDGDALDPGETKQIMNFVPFSGTSTLARSIALVPAPRISTPNAQPVPIPGNLLLDINGAAFDDFVLLLGATPVGFDAPVPPFGTIALVPIFFSAAANLGPSGQVTLTLPVPLNTPSPATIWFAAAVGKAPYRTYLSNSLPVNF